MEADFDMQTTSPFPRVVYVQYGTVSVVTSIFTFCIHVECS